MCVTQLVVNQILNELDFDLFLDLPFFCFTSRSMDSKISTKGEYENPEKEQQVYLAIGFTEKANKTYHLSQTFRRISSISWDFYNVLFWENLQTQVYISSIDFSLQQSPSSARILNTCLSDILLALSEETPSYVRFCFVFYRTWQSVRQSIF